MIGLAARTDDPKALRETLARLQDPVARALAEDPEAPPVFSTREVAGVDTYSLRVVGRLHADLRGRGQDRRRRHRSPRRSTPSSPSAARA